ncbi:putative bifunctional diguanylate cyclase/phosphodiesterase [Cellulomonas endometrii]|uniref:putative bifunctional diguanylate cyclase/phosphodiesterase n=1 Tax=Cellulomonas endometrii TaxID=3036301 RepID=UPI0024AD8EB6|nr:EAL domain-containing protein [Cellulomonas endometrii]
MILVSAGQAVAVAIVIALIRSGSRSSVRDREAWLDFVIIGTVLVILAAQLVAAAGAERRTLSALIIPSVDVAVLGMLLRWMLTRRGLPSSAYLLLAATGLTLVYDLLAAVDGRRLAAAGDPAQALGTLATMLFAVAALEPSMVAAFDPRTYVHRRPASVSLLGMMPLVGAPVVLWWIASSNGSPGLPTWVLLASGSTVAGLCLLRAVRALHGSEYLADHDPLTGLANRRALARMYGTTTCERDCSLLLVDIDEFKQINDTHGHRVGDELLLAIRDRLSQPRGGVRLVARMGGDEFVVLADSEHADNLASEIVRAVREPVVIEGLELQVSASIGITDAPVGSDLDEGLTRADVAMYAAKAQGRDTTARFHPYMRAQVAHRFTLTSQLRALLGVDAQDVGHLVLHYQPVVNLRTGEVVSAEALVRWSHPELGLLAPAKFLNIVHDNGLDRHLDAAVLRHVVDQLESWQHRGVDLVPVSVNLTSASLADPELAPTILSLLHDADIDPGHLRLEITEHEELPSDGPAASTLAALHEAGIDLLLDDYGVGYTSLDYLHRFPIQVLKLDRSVTSNEDTPRALIAGITALARTLNLIVLAEGIETLEQRDMMVAQGVSYGQGYLFARPLPPHDFAGLLRTRDRVMPLVESPAALTENA